MSSVHREIGVFENLPVGLKGALKGVQKLQLQLQLLLQLQLQLRLQPQLAMPMSCDARPDHSIMT